MTLAAHLLTPPQPSLRFLPVWRRNFLVWRKLLVPSLLGNFADPLLYLLVLGYGLGRLVGEVEGLSYMAFLASGIVCSSAMMGATFEALYSAYTRLTMQQTWSAMLNAPLSVNDIVLGEIVWAATKALINATAIIIVTLLFDLARSWQALLALPVVALAGLCFGALAMIVTTVSRSYDFFLYYFTLAITPMMLISGVFFPLAELPDTVVRGAMLLPLAHVVAVVRPLMVGEWPALAALHLLVVAAYAFAAIWVASALGRQRLS
ncbi:ABC transporter permease [Arhodomonas sp. AD133]|uniref:ABC transporter permease n=1 Tax=Arhodomonas sp. AD133 TaxID=3415009 RepID=UPI003EBB57D7